MIKALPKFIVTAVFFISPSVLADWQQPELSHNLTPVKKSVAASDFELQNMDEENKKLSDYRGQVVLLNFWATWCPPCIREMPSMERLHQDINAKNFKVIAINQMEEIDDVFAFTGQLEVDPTFEILFDINSEQASLLEMGNYIKFEEISLEEFEEISDLINNNNYLLKVEVIS